MNTFIKLNTEPDAEGFVSFIANKTKNNYINLGGLNDKNAIDCVHSFLCMHGVWNETDYVIHARKLKSYIPDPKVYHDISFVLRFYNMARISKETREKSLEKPQIVQSHENNDAHSSSEKSKITINVSVPAHSSPPENKVIVKQLTNPNISHDHKLSSNEHADPLMKSDAHQKDQTKNNKEKKPEMLETESIDDIIELEDSDHKSDLSHEKTNSESETSENKILDMVNSNSNSEDSSDDTEVELEDLDDDEMEHIAMILQDEESDDYAESENSEHSNEESESGEESESSEELESDEEPKKVKTKKNNKTKTPMPINKKNNKPKTKNIKPKPPSKKDVVTKPKIQQANSNTKSKPVTKKVKSPVKTTVKKPVQKKVVYGSKTNKKTNKGKK